MFKSWSEFTPCFKGPEEDLDTARYISFNFYFVLFEGTDVDLPKRSKGEKCSYPGMDRARPNYHGRGTKIFRPNLNSNDHRCFL